MSDVGVKQVLLNLPYDEWLELKEIAFEKRMTLTAFIKDLIRENVHSKQKNTFEDWLSFQINRDDIVGDLANDFNAFIKGKGLKGEKCNKAHLTRNNACSGAFEALTQARKEYSSS